MEEVAGLWTVTPGCVLLCSAGSLTRRLQLCTTAPLYTTISTHRPTVRDTTRVAIHDRPQLQAIGGCHLTSGVTASAAPPLSPVAPRLVSPRRLHESAGLLRPVHQRHWPDSHSQRPLLRRCFRWSCGVVLVSPLTIAPSPSALPLLASPASAASADPPLLHCVDCVRCALSRYDVTKKEKEKMQFKKAEQEQWNKQVPATAHHHAQQNSIQHRSASHRRPRLYLTSVCC